MKILVPIGGTQNGLDTPSGGEVRLAMNQAEMMALEGHQVFCLGSGYHHLSRRYEIPRWGNQKPIPNITMVALPEIRGEKFDLVLNCPLEYQDEGKWKLCTELPVKARLKVISLFSWHEGIEDSLIKNYFGGKVPDSGWMVGTPYQYPQLANPIFPMRWIPFPYFKEYAPLNYSNRKSITWACKDVFTDEWKEDKLIHTVGIKVLEAITLLCDKYKLHLNYVTGQTLSGERANRFGALKLVKSINSKTVVPYFVPMSTMHDWLMKSIFTVILPGYAGSAFNAVGDGCPAVFFQDQSSFADILYSPHRLTIDMNTDEIVKFLERFLLDESVYNDFIINQRKQVDPFSFKNAYNKTLESVKEIL